MIKDAICEAIESAYGCEAEHLWLKYPNCAVFRHHMSGKWFALLMDLRPSQLSAGETAPARDASRASAAGRPDGLPSAEPVVWVLTVKCDPLMRQALLKEPGFFPAYHMNKSQWITVLLDGTVPDERILPLVELSYAAVAPKPKRRTGSPS